MSVADRIRARKTAISARWGQEVLREVPALAAMSATALVDHLPEFLEGLARWIEGDVGDARDAFAALADGHALQRHAAGVELEALTREYAILRRVILEEMVAVTPPEDLVLGVVALAAGIDRAIAGAVHRYASARDHVRERFIGILAHDLRDPLTAVMMSANLLADLTLSPKQRQLVERITRSAGRIERMIDDVLDFARGRLDGGIPVSPGLVDMREVCAAAVEEARAGTPDRPVRLEAEGDLRGFWDRDRARQAMSNLVANARTHGQGEIVVRAYERDDRHAVVTTVTNAGPPIPPELLARLFDPFARASAPGTRGGLGLGLYIVDQIARAHGARTSVASTADEGTTFTIEWPRTPVEETPGRPT